MIGMHVPDVIFKTRIRDANVAGENPFRWQDVSTEELFARKRVAVFSLPGAFTPVCSTSQCPAYEERYDELRSLGMDEVYCIAVNDAFVMFQWAKHLSITKTRLLPDGSGHFTRRMGMLVNKDHLGFGYRSWRYSMVVANSVIEKFFCEPGINDTGADDDPYSLSAPEVMIEYLKSSN